MNERSEDVIIVTLMFVKVPVSSVMDERNEDVLKDVSYVARTSQ